MSQTDTVAVLERLIAFPTVSSDSNLELIDWIREFLAQHGVEARLTFDDDGRKANLFASIGAGDNGIILSGHTDVVPVAGQDWASDPFTAVMRDRRIYGRGSCDMKGFIASTLALVPELVRRPTATPVHLAFSYDEEIGCLGARRMLEDLKVRGIKARGCIVGEPTDMRVTIGHKGAGMYRFTVLGRAVHSSLAPSGVNAIDFATRVIGRFRDIADRLEQTEARLDVYDVPYSTIQANRMNGGVAGNIVADRCEFTIDIRHLPSTDRSEILAEVDSYITGDLLPKMRAVAPEANVSWKEVGDVPAFEIASDAPLVRSVARSNSVESACGYVAFGSEAGLFQRAGIPTLICGPGSIEQAHKPDEYVSLEQLERCDRMLKDVVFSAS